MAVQTKGRGLALVTSMYWLSAAIRSGTLGNVPRRIRFWVIWLSQRSTMFSYEDEVGTKWKTKRGCFEIHAFTAGWLWVA